MLILPLSVPYLVASGGHCQCLMERAGGVQKPLACLPLLVPGLMFDFDQVTTVAGASALLYAWRWLL